MNISEDRTFVIEMAKRLTLFPSGSGRYGSLQGTEAIMLLAGPWDSQHSWRQETCPSSWEPVCIGCGLRAPGSRLRAPAEKPAQEPHFWSLALRALGANTGPSSDPSLVKVGFGWPRLFQCFVSNNWVFVRPERARCARHTGCIYSLLCASLSV